jgi:hypothetical protein
MRATNTHKFSQVSPNYKPITASLHPLIVWYRHDHVSRCDVDLVHFSGFAQGLVHVDDGRDGIPALHAW